MSGFDNDLFADVERVPQDDGPNPVVVIDYNPQFVRLMDLFRGLLHRGELSERALALTEELLAENASNYTVWQYRRECLRFLGSDLTKELEYMNSFAHSNPKNYQIWHHRRAVVQDLGNCDSEFDFTREVFIVDAKNYHAWAHRQWACKTYGVWIHELPLVQELLAQDVRNNSAWNHRWFVVHKGEVGSATTLSEAECLAEVEFCFAQLDAAKRNESPWNYLRGLVRRYPHLPSVRLAALEGTRALVNSTEGGNPHAVAALAELVEDRDQEEGGEAAQRARDEAIGWLTLLVSIDGIRAKAWLRKIQEKQQQQAQD